MSRDPRVDAYIAKSPDYARPILTTIREAIHAVVPEVEESIKWSNPAFDYKGPLVGIAAFKNHCALRFWKFQLLGIDHDAFGTLTSVDDLPPRKELVALLTKLKKLNDEGVKVEKPKRAPKPEAKTPPDLAAALKKNKKAATAWDGFPPSHRREYVQWITEAKTEETRKRRLDQAIEWIAEGKSRNWKYLKK